MYLKQSTAVTIKMGPFVDSGDGNTQETGLTISQADIRLSKNGGAYAQTNNAAGATHDEKGNYGVPLDTTDTNTLGTLRVHIHESGALPVWQDFMVVPANVWDTLFGSDKFDVNVEEWNTTAVPAEHTGGYPIVTIKDGTGTGEINTNAGAIALVDLVTTTTTATNVTTVNGLGANVITAAATAADFGTEVGTAVWASATRTLTSLAGLTVDTVTNVTTVNGLAANVITAAATAADFGTEIGTAVWASATRTLTSLAGLTVDTVTTVNGLAANVITAAATAADFGTEVGTAVWASATRTLTSLSGLTVDTVTNVTTVNGLAADVITASSIAAGAIGSSEAPLLANLDVAVSTRLASAGYTAPDNASIAAILVDTGTDIPASLATIAAFLDTEVAAIKAKTDQLTFTVALQVDATVSSAGTALNTYQGRCGLTDDNNAETDRYTVIFYKNGQPVTSGITSPTIQVIKMSDGTDLIASTALIEVGSNGFYRYDEAVNRVLSGAAYMVKMTATIDSATRTWLTNVSRDST